MWYRVLSCDVEYCHVMWSTVMSLMCCGVLSCDVEYCHVMWSTVM